MAIKGFRVYRKPANGSKYTLVNQQLLPSDARQYDDRAFPTTVNAFRYGITAVLVDGSEASSQPAVLLYEYAPPVRGLKVKRIVKNGKVYIRCTWDPPLPGEDRFIKRYLLGYGEGDDEFAYKGSLGDLRECKYDLRVWSREDTVYTIQVVIRGTNLLLGKPAKTTIKIRGRLWKAPPKPKFVDHSKNYIYCTIRWDYAEDNRLAGFELYRSALPSGDRPRMPKRLIRTVPADVRSVRIGPHVPRVPYVYCLRAIDHDGLRTKESIDSMYQIVHSRQGTLMDDEVIKIRSELSDLKATFHEDPMGPDFVDVSWDLAKDDLDLVRYYLVQPEQKDAAVGEMPAKTTSRHIRIPIHEDFNGKLKVGVQIEHVQGKVFDPQYVTVNIPARQPMPDFFPRKQVLIYCGVASALVFIVLIVGLTRKRGNSESLAEAA